MGYGPDVTYKIVVFGDGGVGKTTLLNLTKTYETVEPNSSMDTIGIGWYVKDLIVEDKKVRLGIWCFSGEELLFPTCVKGANGGLFMYDITNYSSLTHIDYWLTLIRMDEQNQVELFHKKTYSLPIRHKFIQNHYPFPIIIVGNKGDLMEKREISVKEAMDIAKSKDLDAFIECSSKTGENAEEVFETLTRLMLKKSDFI